MNQKQLNALRVKYKPSIETRKQVKITSKRKQYEQLYPHVTYNDVFRHFLKELGEVLTAKTPDSMLDELADLSNMIDFLYAIVIQDELEI